MTFGIGLHEVYQFILAIGLCNARFACGSSTIIPLINTHRHTVLKKYRLKYLILPGNSQGQGQIPGNPKKHIEMFLQPPKMKLRSKTVLLPLKRVLKIQIQIPRSNPVLKIVSSIWNPFSKSESQGQIRF